MKSIRAIIIDDEPKSCEGLRTLLHDFCNDVEVVALCNTVDEGIEKINSLKPDLIFLDIQMKGETGFDLLNKLPKPYTFEIIFSTAHSDFALKAFRFSAIDYLLKPVDVEELKKAVEKVSQRNSHNLAVRLQQLMDNMKPSAPQQFKLAIPASDGLTFIKISDIVYCMASDNYTYFFMSDGQKYLVSRTLKEYEDLLSEHNFFRVHNSYLININAVKKYIRGEGGQVVMNNDAVLDVAKRRKEAFIQLFGR